MPADCSRVIRYKKRLCVKVDLYVHMYVYIFKDLNSKVYFPNFSGYVAIYGVYFVDHCNNSTNIIQYSEMRFCRQNYNKQLPQEIATVYVFKMFYQQIYRILPCDWTNASV